MPGSCWPSKHDSNLQGRGHPSASVAVSGHSRASISFSVSRRRARRSADSNASIRSVSRRSRSSCSRRSSSVAETPPSCRRRRRSWLVVARVGHGAYSLGTPAVGAEPPSLQLDELADRTPSGRARIRGPERAQFIVPSPPGQTRAGAGRLVHPDTQVPEAAVARLTL